jgi:hypothetical protein
MNERAETHLHEAVQHLWKASVAVDDPEFERLLKEMRDDVKSEWKTRV